MTAETESDTVLRKLGDVRDRFLGRLTGLDDREYLWEPVPGCWTLRPDPGGSWTIDGDGGGGPPPDPVPFTTIAWRIGHIGLTFLVYADRLHGDGDLALGDVALASTADDAITFVDDAYRTWRDGLTGLDAAAWRRPLGPKFAAYGDRTVFSLAIHVLDEFVHHAAEVGVLRDLYVHRDHFTP